MANRPTDHPTKSDLNKPYQIGTILRRTLPNDFLQPWLWSGSHRVWQRGRDLKRLTLILARVIHSKSNWIVPDGFADLESLASICFGPVA